MLSQSDFIHLFHMGSVLNVSYCSYQLSFKPTFYTFICISPQQVFMVNDIVISKKIHYNYFTSTFVTVLTNTYMFYVHVVLTCSFQFSSNPTLYTFIFSLNNCVMSSILSHKYFPNLTWHPRLWQYKRRHTCFIWIWVFMKVL